MHSIRNADLRLVGLVERVASATLTFGLKLGCPESGSYSGRDYSQLLLSLAAKRYVQLKRMDTTGMRLSTVATTPNLHCVSLVPVHIVRGILTQSSCRGDER